ncbi:MAG: HRDC domain-containing protein, partial [Myxococcota bacterium]
RHFGDRDDNHDCGLCDACAPDGCVAARFRPPTGQEAKELARLLLEVDDWRGTAAGALYRRLFGDAVSRNEYERWLDALVRAGLLVASEETFEKDGKQIRYRRVFRKPGATASLDDVRLPDVRTKGRSSRGPTKKAQPATPKRKTGKPRKVQSTIVTDGSEADAKVVERLRDWRLRQARSKRVPAFRIMTDRTMYAIATILPESKDALLRVHGVGPKLADKYGAMILSLIRSG